MNDQDNWKEKVLEGTHFTESELEEETNKLQILVFRLDGRGQNVVSSINGTIVFVDRWYSGEKVKVGDIWLCSVRYTGSVYHAMPMKKITVDMIMGMSEGLRNDIVDALWNTNRKDYERLFEERYKSEIHKQALEEANRENRQIVSRMQARIDTLMKQVEQTNYILTKPDYQDEIILTSDILDQPSASNRMSPDQMAYQMITPSPEVQLDYRPLPDILPVAERVSEDTIYCDMFTDGRCKVLISPDYKTIEVSRCAYGMTICSRNRIVVRNLEKMSPFIEPKKLIAEKVDNCTVHLSL